MNAIPLQDKDGKPVSAGDLVLDANGHKWRVSYGDGGYYLFNEEGNLLSEKDRLPIRHLREMLKAP
jgi:hypothetical protein